MKKLKIFIDFKGIKKALKAELDNGYIDNLRYIEMLDWFKRLYEKEKI